MLKIIKRFGKFTIVGAFTACCNFAGIYIMTELIGLWYMLSIIIMGGISVHY